MTYLLYVWSAVGILTIAAGCYSNIFNWSKRQRLFACFLGGPALWVFFAAVKLCKIVYSLFYWIWDKLK